MDLSESLWYYQHIFKQTVRLSIERGARERWTVNNKYIEEGVIKENDFLTYFFWFQKPILQAIRILETICRDNGLTTAYESPLIIVSRNNVRLFHVEAFTDWFTLRHTHDGSAGPTVGNQL